MVGFAGSELLRYATSVMGARRHKVAGLAQDLGLSALVLSTSGLGLLAARWLAPPLRAIAWRPAKLGTFLEGLGIAMCVSVGWGVAYFRYRQRRELVERPG